MIDSKITIGIIGAGRMGITHYSIINSHPNIKIVAVADTSSVINALLEKYVGVQTFKDCNKLLEKAKPDAILVCTPPFLNNDILNQAAVQGVHAFVEKPYTVSYAQGIALAELFEEKKLVNQVGYVNRFNDVFLKVKNLIDEGVVGDIIRFKTEMYSRTIISEELESSWRSTKANGGGVIYEMASHSIDLVNFILGKPDKVVGTSLTKLYSKNVEDIVSSTFLYKNGISGVLYVNWSDESFRKPTNKLEFFGSKGKIQADQHGFKIYLKEENKAYGYRQGWNSVFITDTFNNVPFYVRGNEFTSQLYHFVDCIQAGGSTQSLCTFRDAAATLSIIEDMFNDFAQTEKELK